MLETLRDMIRHKNYANAALLNAIAQFEPAAKDPGFPRLLHHIILANRFWLSLFMGERFDLAGESKAPESLGEIAAMYRQTEEQETAWAGSLRETDLERVVATPFLPEQQFSVMEGVLQVCLHSHGHRAQCAARLRDMGGSPPAMDFVFWLKQRPMARWIGA